MKNKLTENNRQMAMVIMTAALMATVLVAAFYYFVPTVMAADPNVLQIFNIVGTVLRTISTIVGAIMVLAGIFQYAPAHANDNGPDQQKGIMMLATGVVLIILFTVIINSKVIEALANMVSTT